MTWWVCEHCGESNLDEEEDTCSLCTSCGCYS
jgi:hypothetical protein